MATFRQELPGLLTDPINEGKYVLIHADSIAGVFPDLESGLEAGYLRFELAPFLVKKITAHKEPKYFSRNFQCPT